MFEEVRPSLYAVPDIITQNISTEIIWTPWLIMSKIEREFNIPTGQIWLKTRAPQFAIARYAFLYIIQVKMGVEPAVILLLYGVKHDKCYQARKVIDDIIKTKTPRHYAIRIEKILSKIKLWDITEISQQLASLFAENATVLESKKNFANQSIQRALAIASENAKSVMAPEELNKQ